MYVLKMRAHTFTHSRRFRLYFVMCACYRTQTISFDASEMAEGTVVPVGIDLVKERVSDMLQDSDLSKYII